jgi:hypothetical protein
LGDKRKKNGLRCCAQDVKQQKKSKLFWNVEQNVKERKSIDWLTGLYTFAAAWARR